MSASAAIAFRASLAALAPAFTAPTFVSFEQLVIGWVLSLGRHTVTGVLQASGAVGTKHHTSFHRFFRHSKWEPDQVALLLLRMVISLIPSGETILVPLDDTLSRHTGKRIAAASMHHDPLLSTRTRTAYHWGHVWVVLSIALSVPRWGKTFALPVLVRLYRSEKLCKKESRTFKKKTELAAELIAVLANALPERNFLVLGDAGYANASVIRTLPANVQFTGRARLDAALYALPTRNPRGRRRIKGARLPTPEVLARSRHGWTCVRVTVYGKTVNLRTKTIDALWYKVGRERLIRIVIVRGWPGHDHDDALCTTDLSQSATAVIETYCKRWSLEISHSSCTSCHRSLNVLNRDDGRARDLEEAA